MNLKRLTIIFIAAALLFCLPGRSQETKEEKFKKALELYSAGDYEKALQTWTEVYITGYRSAELDYNIGNTYFKLNNVPGAILYFERAHLLKPADEDINYNLAIAKTLAVDRFNEIPELFFARWYDFISLVFSSNAWAKISISAFILFLISLSIYFYTSRYKLKVFGFWLALLLFIVSATSLAFSFRNRTLVQNSHKAIIFDPQVNGKSSPDESGTNLFLLHEGTKVTVGEKVGDWYEIRLSDGNKGWVPATSLEII
jgi:tetratricopeptide (TPR) repeat protein